MAYSTLIQLRQNGLNLELGLASDTDVSFGTTAQRNFYIQRSIAGLWPNMARLTRESITSVLNQQDYNLVTLYDVERIEIMDTTNPLTVQDRIKDFTHYLDEAADPPTSRLLITRGMNAGLTLRIVGYAPYTIPALDATVLDIPPRLEWIVTAGARVWAYRAMLNKYANFERFQNENRQNALTSADMVELLRQAIREYGQGIQENHRNLTASRRAMLKAGS